jgi:hypothetical protein
MKDFELGEGRVLLIKENGKFYATGNKCTHYGAPLKTGVSIVLLALLQLQTSPLLCRFCLTVVFDVLGMVLASM